MDPKGLLMIGGVLVGGYLALSTMKDMKAELPAPQLATALGSRPLNADSRTRAEGNPADYLVERSWGYNAEGPIANHDLSRAVFIEDAIKGWRPAYDDEVVARVQMLETRKDCSMPAPASGARVVNLLIEHPRTKSGLYSFSEAEVLESVDDWLASIRRKETPDTPGPVASHEYRVHDIAVTATDAPVYFVFQTFTSGNVLYNFHLGPGASVAGVAMIGSNANAVANLPDNVPVAVMTHAALKACGVPIRDAVRGEAGIQSRIRDLKMSGEEEIAAARAELAQGVATYESWFQAQFGIPAAEGRFGHSFAEVSLIGPVPADPALRPAYAPLQGASVVAQAEEYFKIEGLHSWPEAYREEVTRMGTVIAGGDPLLVARPQHMVENY